MSNGRRFVRNGRDLNMTKVFLIIALPILIVAFIFSLKNILETSTKASEENGKKAYFSLYSEGKFGVIDERGRIVIPADFSEVIQIPNPEQGIFICTYNIDYENNTYQTKVLNEKAEEILTGFLQVEPLENEDGKEAFWYEDDVLTYKKDDKYGLIDFSGKVLADAQYDKITTLKGIKNSLLVTKGDKVGLYNIRGEEILEANYKSIEAAAKDYQDGYLVNDGSKLGYSTASGMLTYFEYDEIVKIERT